MNGPFVPHIDLSEPCCFTKVQDGPQTYNLIILWLQDEGAQKTGETLDEHQNTQPRARDMNPRHSKKRSIIVTLLTKVFDQFIVNKYCAVVLLVWYRNRSVSREWTQKSGLLVLQMAISDDLRQDVDNTGIIANKLLVSLESLQRQ